MGLFEERQIACKNISMFSTFQMDSGNWTNARNIFWIKWKSNIEKSFQWNMFHWESSWIIELKCVLHKFVSPNWTIFCHRFHPPARILVLWYHLNYDSEWTQFRSGAKIRFFDMKYLPSIWIFRYRNQLGTKSTWEIPTWNTSRNTSTWKISIFGISSFYRNELHRHNLFLYLLQHCWFRTQTFPYFRVCVFFPNAFGLFDHFVQTIWLLIRFPVKFVYPSTPNGFHFCHPSTETSYK